MAGEYERLVEDVALELARIDYENNTVKLPSIHHYAPARRLVAVIAERTKAATDAMLDAYMKTTLGDCPDEEWSAMHAASALWPPRGEEPK